MLDDCEFNDLGFIGRWFTWERGRFLSTNIRERLDKGVSSLDWMNLFSGYQVEHLSRTFSNHCRFFWTRQVCEEMLNDMVLSFLVLRPDGV